MVRRRGNHEALTNVYRHAVAKSVHVRIMCRDGSFRMAVADDGRGIPQEVLAKFHGARQGEDAGSMRTLRIC
jgi:signal transduction histidine kinase